MKAYETQLTFSDNTGHAVIAEFGLNYRLVFWSKAQYVGCWDLGKNVWFTPEWLETNSPEDYHCYEPIMDKKLKYSKATIAESNEVRVKIRWTYACNDMRYRIFHGNTTAEEVYTVYTDGIAVRKLTAFPGDLSGYGGNPNMWQVLEWIVINGTGTTPDDTIQHKNAFALSNEKGESISLDWPIQFDNFQPLCEPFPEIAEWDMYIGKVNLVDRPSPFVIIVKDQRLFAYRPCGYCGKDHPYFNLFSGIGNVYKHWPASDDEEFILADKGNKVVGKQATHSSFIDGNYAFRPFLLNEDEESQRKAARYYVETPAPGTSWLFLTGATEKSHDYLIELAKSWYYPAKVLTGNECIKSIPGMSSGPVLYEGYAYSERAYTFRKSGPDKIEFTMSPKFPVINPVFNINGWKSPKASVSIDQKTLNQDKVVCAISGNDLVVMVKGRFSKEITVSITN
jgi:hypothetical protein